MESDVESLPRPIADTVNLLSSRGYDVRIGYRDDEPAAVRAVLGDTTIMIDDWRRTWACALRSPEIDYDEMYDRRSRVESEVRDWLEDLED